MRHKSFLLRFENRFYHDIEHATNDYMKVHGFVIHYK